MNQRTAYYFLVTFTVNYFTLTIVYIKCMCSDQMHIESESAEQCGTTTANQNIFDV